MQIYLSLFIANNGNPVFLAPSEIHPTTYINSTMALHLSLMCNFLSHMNRFSWIMLAIWWMEWFLSFFILVTIWWMEWIFLFVFGFWWPSGGWMEWWSKGFVGFHPPPNSAPTLADHNEDDQANYDHEENNQKRRWQKHNFLDPGKENMQLQNGCIFVVA